MAFGPNLPEGGWPTADTVNQAADELREAKQKKEAQRQAGRSKATPQQLQEARARGDLGGDPQEGYPSVGGSGVEGKKDLPAMGSTASQGSRRMTHSPEGRRY